jgi:LysR family hydrogen peroxide-inducible transcriptional activator
LIPLLRRYAPRMPLLIEENYTAVLSERLKEGKLDAILISLPYAVSGISSEALYEESFAVLLPRQHRLEKMPTIRAGLLAQEEVLLLGAGHCFRDQVLESCPECGRSRASTDSIQQSLEGSSLETLRLMVASGMGITVVPQTSVNGFFPGQDMLSVRGFAEPMPRRTIALAWRKSFTRPDAIKVIIEAILECRLGEGVTMLPAA